MTTTKTVRWDEVTTAKLVGLYAGKGTDLEVVAKEMGMTVAAVRGKLVSMKIYEKQEPRAVGGASSVRKGNLTRELAKVLDVEHDRIESLEKASKSALELLLKVLTEGKE